MDNPYLDHYVAQLDHQREHMSRMLFDDRPHEFCMTCLTERTDDADLHGAKLRYAWAVPGTAALDAVAEHSPSGVVEIGAGAGYWAWQLRQRGVDVAAYDPAPPDHESEWHGGYAWSDVEVGDHQAVTKHPDRTLLLVWPNYGHAWADEVIELYDGDIVIHVGEPPGGCTGTDRMHELLGSDQVCWCPDECECAPAATAKFERIDVVPIPQWFGINDRLFVHKRR